MSEEEFSSALQSRFRNCQFYTQHPDFAPWWSIRTFVSDNTSWGILPGFKRARRVIQRVVAREAVRDPTDRQRNNIQDLILRLGKKPHQFLNPYALRHRRKWNGEEPTYIVATAIR
jgi:hypothetical protein